jgi:hypothetical protein
MQVLVQRPEGKRPLRRTRPRLEDNIQMDLPEMERGHRLDYSGLGYGRVAVFCECGGDIRFL